jgi:hypothetical protein
LTNERKTEILTELKELETKMKLERGIVRGDSKVIDTTNAPYTQADFPADRRLGE